MHPESGPSRTLQPPPPHPTPLASPPTTIFNATITKPRPEESLPTSRIREKLALPHTTATNAQNTTPHQPTSKKTYQADRKKNSLPIIIAHRGSRVTQASPDASSDNHPPCRNQPSAIGSDGVGIWPRGTTRQRAMTCHAMRRGWVVRWARRLWRAGVRAIPPDTGAHVAAARCKHSACRAGSNRNDRVLVALQHQLRDASRWVPELHAAVLGAAENPFAVWSEGNAQNEVLVSFERPKTLATARPRSGHHVRLCRQLPHLNRLVKTSTDEPISRGSKSNRVDTILVPDFAFQSLDETAGGGVPHADALIKRARSNEAVVWRDCHSCDAVFNRQLERLPVVPDVPQSDRAVATAGRNELAITREVQRVDILLVTSELVPNSTSGNLPNLKASQHPFRMDIHTIRRRHKNIP